MHNFPTHPSQHIVSSRFRMSRIINAISATFLFEMVQGTSGRQLPSQFLQSNCFRQHQLSALLRLRHLWRVCSLELKLEGRRLMAAGAGGAQLLALLPNGSKASVLASETSGWASMQLSSWLQKMAARAHVPPN
jgi:hypothetical protein